MCAHGVGQAPFHINDGNTGEVFFSIFGAQMLTTVTRKRYISFILLLCFAVIPAHNMIPHHHHNGVVVPAEETDCPLNHQDQHKESQEKHPLHCHAFNEISFYKNVLPGLSQPSELPVLYANHPSSEQTAPGLRFVKSIINPRTVPVHSRYCGDVVSLRGPPSAA